MATKLEDVIEAANRGAYKGEVTATDKDGKVVGTASSWRDAYEQGWVPGYNLSAMTNKAYVVDNKITFQEPQNVSSVFDKTTGKITITAPSIVANNETFRERVNALTEFSEAYAIDKNYAVPALNATGTATTNETISVSEFLSRLDTKKDDQGKTVLDYWAEDARSIEGARDQLKAFVKNPNLQLTDDQVRKAFAIALDNKETGEKANDNTMQLISTLEEADFLRNSEGYDEETSMIDLKHLMEDGWNRDKVSDDKIKALQGALERYFAEGDFSDGDEFARNYATYAFMQGRDPGVNFWRGAAEWLGSFLLGTVKSGTSFTLSALRFQEKYTGIEWLTKLGDDNSIAERFFGGKTLFQLLDEYQRDWFEEWQDDQALFNDGNITALGAGEFIGDMIQIIAIGNIGESLAKGALSKAIAGLSAVAKGAEAINLTTITGITLGTTEISKATRIITSLLGAKQTATFFTGLVKMLNSAPVIGAVGIIGETIAESIVGDGEMFRDVLSSGELDAEARAYLFENWVWNTVGVVGAFGASKAIYKFGQTKAGMAMSHNWSRRVKKITSWLGDFADSVRMKIRGIDNIDDMIKRFKNPKKQDAWRMARELRAMDKAVANMDKVKFVGKTKDEVLEQIHEARKAVMGLQEMDNAITELARGGRGIANRWTNSLQYATLKGTNEALQKTTESLIKAEKGVDGFRYVGKTMDGRLFSQLTTDYIGSVHRLDYIDNYLKVKKNIDIATRDAIDKEIAWLKGNIEEFLSKATPDIKKLADQYITQNREWWHGFTDVLTKENVLSASQIEDLRQLGYWGDDGLFYARTQRQVELGEYTRARRDGRVDAETWSALQNTSFGTTDHFVDPTLVQQSELYRRANQAARQQILRTHLNWSDASFSVKVTGEQTKALRELKGTQPQLEKISSQYAKDIGGNLKTSGVVEAMVSSNEAAAKVTAGTRRKLMTEAKISTVMEATDESIGKLFTGVSGFNTASEYVEATLALGTASDLEKGVRDVFDAYAKQYDGAINFTKKNGKVVFNYDNYKLIADLDDTIDGAMARGYCSSNSKALKDPSVKKMAKDRYNTLLTDYIAKSDDFSEGALDITKAIKEEIAAYTKNVTTHKESSKIVKNLSASLGAEGNEAVERYIALRELERNADDIFGAKFTKDLSDDFKKALQGKTDNLSLPDQEAEKLTKKIKAAITDEADSARKAIGEMYPELVDAEDVYNKVNALAEEITKVKRDPNVVGLPNMDGEIEYIQVDPLLAGLVKTQSPVKELKPLGHINYMLMKLFRLGTTGGLSLRSMVNQQFRDFLNAFVMGGAYRSTQQCADLLEDVFGERIVEALKRTDPDELRAIKKLAKDLDISEGAAFAKYELDFGRAVSPSVTETDARRITREANQLRYSNGEFKRNAVERTEKAIDKVADFVGHPNELRESTMRNISYANAFTDAIKNGSSVKAAREQATYIMNNATTNFSQFMQHFTALQDTVPYLGAAISGSKSFWKLWSLDPVGISGRIFGGLILPAMYMTGMSLASKENRDIWKNIPEYQKKDNILFVMNGEVMSIPIPQEVSWAVSPWVSFVEYLHNTNTNDFWAVMANDIIGLSPIDLEGFLNIDGGKLLGDNTVLNNIGRGFAQMIANNSPLYVKTAIMAATGIDPYTMAPIDRSYKYLDPDTGQVEIMDSTQGAFAKGLAKLAKKFGWDLSPSAADALLGSILGNGTVDVADALVGWTQAVATGGEEGSWDAPFQNLVNQALAPLTVNVYSKSESDWRDAVNTLSAERKSILNSEEWNLYLEARRKATQNGSESDWKKVSAMRHDIIDPYYEKVQSVVNNLINLYGQDFTHRKFATVLALMNTNEGGIDAGSYGDQLNSDAYYAGKNAAIATMAQMGFASSSNSSIFGTWTKSSTTGEGYMRFYDPIDILNMQNSKWYGSNTHQANMENILKAAGLTKSERYEQYNKLKTSAEKKKFRQDWNARVVNALYPYVQRYGANAIINSSTTDFLDDYIYVDNPFNAQKYLIKIFGGNA